MGGQSGERLLSAVDDSVLAAAGVGALRLRQALPSRTLHQPAALELLNPTKKQSLFPLSERTRLRSSRIQAQKALVRTICRSRGVLRMRSKNLTDPVVEFYEGLRAEGGGRGAAGGGGEVGVAPEVARQPGQVAVAHQVVVSQLEAAQSEQRLEHVFSERRHVVVVQSAANAIMSIFDPAGAAIKRLTGFPGL